MEKKLVGTVMTVLFTGIVVACTSYFTVDYLMDKQKTELKAEATRKYKDMQTTMLNEIASRDHLVEKLTGERNMFKSDLDEIHESMLESKSKEWNVKQATITAYSPLDDQNGINSDGEGETTSIGMRAGYGRFAVDPARIPYGSDMLIVYADGTTEQGIAADTGGAMRQASGIKIDVFRMTFKQAMSFGKKKAIVLWKAPGQ